MEQNSNNSEVLVAAFGRTDDGKWDVELARANRDGVEIEAAFDGFGGAPLVTYTLTPRLTMSGTFGSPVEGLINLTRHINLSLIHI